MPLTTMEKRITLGMGVILLGIVAGCIWYDATHYNTREIEAAMFGKTQAEVRAEFGEPRSISDDGQTWRYNGKEIGYVSGFLDQLMNWYYNVMLEFDENGEVRDVIIDD